MGVSRTICILLLLVQFSNCGILMWSSEKIEFPSLRPFTKDALQELVASLNDPVVVAFEDDADSIEREYKRLLVGKHSAYVPTYEHVAFEDAVKLSGSVHDKVQTVEERLSQLDGNVLALLYTTPVRTKRDVNDTEKASAPSNSRRSLESKSGAILYNADNKFMFYVSKPPVLSVDGKAMVLKGSAVVTSDTRDTFGRLSVSSPQEDGKKIVLRFRFSWPADRKEWSLPSVEVEYMATNTYNLTTNRTIKAPKQFSFSCGGTTVFSNGSVTLKLYDLQTQPTALNGRFSDSYNCVPFTTTPIWSGLFITALLVIGLGIGFSALASIKTMDRFDNARTKQLTITVSE